MRGKFFSWIKGSVQFQVTGNSIERFLNLCAYHEITLWNIRTISNGFEACISVANFRDIKPLVRKCHIHIRILHKKGLPFFVFYYRKRWILGVAVMITAILIGVLSAYIWDIEIHGNYAVTDERIMDYLETVGIHHGVKKNLFDYKMVSSNLRKYFPEITWAAVKMQGTRLFIDLKENSDSSIFEERTQKGGNLIADADGTIKKMITRSGTPAVSVGMEVKKGDLLVSGVVDLINDAGEVYEQAAVIPDADIYIQTFINYNDNIPLIQKKKQYTGKSRRRGLLQIGKIMIGFPFFSKTFDHYDMIVNRKQFRLMENFYLPIYYSDFQIREYRICQVSISKNHAETQLKHNLDLFLKKIEEKGVQIFENNVKIEKTVSSCRMSGKIYIIQKIGQWTDRELYHEKEGTLTE